ncbi:MAG: coiled-coil domain-containing protein [Candidatus Scalindua sp.]
MKRVSFGIIVIFLIMIIGMSITSAIEAGEVSFAQDDRERIIRLEEGQKALNQRIDDINKRFDDVNKRIDDTNKRIDDLREEIRDLKTFMLWGFGILFGGMGILIGFVIWDRRTAIAPVAGKTRELEEEGGTP